MAERSLPVTDHLDLPRTLRPLYGHFSSEGWRLPVRTPEGPGTLLVRREGERVTGRAWGTGGAWLLERLDAITGLTDDPSSFHTDHPLVARPHRRNPGLRFGRTGLIFHALLHAVCYQRVTNREARLSLQRISRTFSEPAPGVDRLWLPPDPQRLAVVPYWEYHRIGVERRRAEVIRRIAADHARLDSLARESAERAGKVLRSINGIGEWSVAKTLAVSHGDADQVPVGDFHIRHIVVHHLTGRPRGTDQEMLELLEPFRPHRGRVIRLLNLLGSEPKFGPRVAAHDMTRH